MRKLILTTALAIACSMTATAQEKLFMGGKMWGNIKRAILINECCKLLSYSTLLSH